MERVAAGCVHFIYLRTRRHACSMTNVSTRLGRDCTPPTTAVAPLGTVSKMIRRLYCFNPSLRPSVRCMWAVAPASLAIAAGHSDSRPHHTHTYDNTKFTRVQVHRGSSLASLPCGLNCSSLVYNVKACSPDLHLPTHLHRRTISRLPPNSALFKYGS